VLESNGLMIQVLLRLEPDHRASEVAGDGATAASTKIRLPSYSRLTIQVVGHAGRAHRILRREAVCSRRYDCIAACSQPHDPLYPQHFCHSLLDYDKTER
jgi:hypothetical protein